MSFFLAPDALTFTGPGDRFQKNIAALTLAHYSAFGESALLNRLFRYDPATARYLLTSDCATFLSADAARHLRTAALTAFYTPLDLIAVIWQAVMQLGLASLPCPRIIEPAAGVGHFIPTKLTAIAGLPSAHSQRALDMRIKTWDLLRQRKKVVFLTATPIMNTLGEAYVMQLYLQEAQLEAVGIHHFDEWVSLYAQPRMGFELRPDGAGFRMHTRLATFVNLPEMASMWRQVLTVRTKAQMGLPEPTLVTGKIIPVVIPASPALKHYVQTLAARADAVRAGHVDPTMDNMLKVVGDGRKAALDLRRAEARRAVWVQAQTLTAAKTTPTFQAEVATTLDSTALHPFTTRAEAGAAVRTMMNRSQSTATFQQQSRTTVIGCYQGLHLVVRAYPKVPAELMLALPDGTTLDTIATTSDTGVWQRVTQLINMIPTLIERTTQHITACHARIATIDHEHTRLEQWEGQTAYDAAVSELATINATFAAAEEQAPCPAPPSATVNTPDDTALETLRALLAEDPCGAFVATIPPALASLAWMSAATEQQQAQIGPPPRILTASTADPLVSEPPLVTPPKHATVQFGTAIAPKRGSPRPPASTPHGTASGDEMAQQLSLF